jgi:hypothetical protein
MLQSACLPDGGRLHRPSAFGSPRAMSYWQQTVDAPFKVEAMAEG